ncbi:MAG: flagellar hook-basal body complex protein, partial [Polyangiales bacterium]
MSILRSLNTGATGLRSHGTAIGVTGDNIANVNTVGFKRSRAVFQDILGRSVGETNGMPESGGGSKLGHIQQMWSQGSLLTTDSPTDLALSGEGFFIVNGNVNGVQSSFYTRAGQFNLNVDNQLVNADGLVVQGYLADATGQIGVTLGDLQLPEGTIQATPTTTVDIAANLDVNAPVPAAWDVNNPDTTSNFATGVNVYDSLGNAHQISVYFRNQGGGDWEWHAVADGGEITGGTAGVPFEAASGTLNFTTDGVLNTETPAASSWDFLNATAGQAIAFDFGTSIADGG